MPIRKTAKAWYTDDSSKQKKSTYMVKPIKKLVKELPRLTGVYFFKNVANDIIYIGKAKNLHARVGSYFKNYATDWKIKQLIDEYTDIEYILTPTETESLLLE